MQILQNSMDPLGRFPGVNISRSAAFGAAVGERQSSFPGALDLWALREWPGVAGWKSRLRKRKDNAEVQVWLKWIEH